MQQSTTPSEQRSPETRLIVVLNRDVFFGVKIGNTLRALGFQVEFVKTAESLAERILDAAGSVALGVIDINAAPDWAVIREVRSNDSIPLLAFGSHLDVDGMRAAKAAGATRVVSNGDFHRDMVSLVERYARP